MERLNLHNPVIQVTHQVIVMITTAHHLMMIHPCRVQLHQQRLVLNVKKKLENVYQLKRKAKHRDTTETDSETETEKPKRKVKKASKMIVSKAKRKKSCTPPLSRTPKTPPKCSQSPTKLQDNPEATKFDPTSIPLIKTAK